MQRYPVRVQVGEADAVVVGWVELEDHDGPTEMITHLGSVLRKVADEFDEQQRYSRQERD